MLIISHRGNINGPQPETENTPDQIDYALTQCDMCEVDVWKINGDLYLSHDYPEEHHKIDPMFLSERKTRLVIHCKNIEALVSFQKEYAQYNYFWHQEDEYTLTSYCWIWAYPNKPVSENCLSIAVMPDEDMNLTNFAGVCTDYIKRYK